MTTTKIQNVKFKDLPHEAVKDFFISKNSKITEKISTPNWDQVPRSSEQILFEEINNFEQVKKLYEQNRDDQKIRLEKLEEDWKNIEKLENNLKQIFIKTEDQIQHLQKDKRRGENDFKRAKELEKRRELLHNKTAELTIIKHFIDDETRKLLPYMEFIEKVGKIESEMYPNGALSFIQHYDRLCCGQGELEQRQHDALIELQNLRKHSQLFTSEALTKLDILQAKIAQLNQNLDNAVKLNDEVKNKLKNVRKEQEENEAEENEILSAMNVLYEQLWYRYNGCTGTPPKRDIQEQCKYIKIIMNALERLSKDRGIPVDRLQLSLQILLDN